MYLGFLSLEEIDEADYNLADFPMAESGEAKKGLKSKKQAHDGNEEAVDEIIEEEESKGEGDLESPKKKEKKYKNKKKKERKKRVKEVSENVEDDSPAG